MENKENVIKLTQNTGLTFAKLSLNGPQVQIVYLSYEEHRQFGQASSSLWIKTDSIVYIFVCFTNSLKLPVTNTDLK